MHWDEGVAGKTVLSVVNTHHTRVLQRWANYTR